MTRRLFFILKTISCSLLFLAGRTNAQPAADTTVALTMEQYLQWVLDYHPIARQAGLLRDQAEAGLRIARGGFDPKWYAEWQHKSFDGKNYYNLGETGIKLSTRIGMEIKGAYQIANGAFLNPENKLPDRGQAILGVKIPLLQGLLTDERRTQLAQAKLMQEWNEAERLLMLNELLRDAIMAYWDWALAFGQMEIARQSSEIARERLDGLRESFRAGDKPAIDTLETFIQLQNRLFELNEAGLAFQNAGLVISDFLWTETGIPLQVSAELVPLNLPVFSLDGLPDVDRDSLFRFLSGRHPALELYRAKQKQLGLDRRLQVEMLKPRLDLEYNLLGDGFDLNGSGQESVLFENYKVGLRTEFPLFLRKERGKLEMADLKLLDNEYLLQQKQLELVNKLQACLNEMDVLREQIALYESVTANYLALLDAESIKFQLGESSIFLLNSRENKMIETQLKLLEIKTKYIKSHYKSFWAAGLLPRI